MKKKILGPLETQTTPKIANFHKKMTKFDCTRIELLQKAAIICKNHLRILITTII